jgi:hypothetical protein
MRLEDRFPFGKATQYAGINALYAGKKLLPMAWDDETHRVRVAVDGANELDGWLPASDLVSHPEIPPAQATGYVDGNPKTAAGSRKPPLGAIPGPAILALGLAMADGERKYGLTNWREFPVTSSTYLNAARRHLLEFVDGETYDRESGIIQLGHVMACCAIIIDAMAQGTITDDRTQFPGATSNLIKAIAEGTDNALRITRQG